MKYLKKNTIGILAVQESWKIVGKPFFRVPGYLWFGKPKCKEPKNSNLKRGEGGVGFLIREGLQEIINVIHDAEYKGSIWLKLSLGGVGMGACILVVFIYLYKAHM